MGTTESKTSHRYRSNKYRLHKHERPVIQRCQHQTTGMPTIVAVHRSSSKPSKEKISKSRLCMTDGKNDQSPSTIGQINAGEFTVTWHSLESSISYATVRLRSSSEFIRSSSFGYHWVTKAYILVKDFDKFVLSLSGVFSILKRNLMIVHTLSTIITRTCNALMKKIDAF